MIRSGLAHLRRYGLLWTAMAVFGVSLASSFERIKDAQESALATAGASMWLTHQAEFELQRLIHALDLHAMGDPATTREAVLERFDIFWSRLPLLIEGADSRLIAAVGDVERLVPPLIARLGEAEAALARLPRGDAPVYRALRRLLVAQQEPFRQLSLQVDQAVARAHSGMQQKMRALYTYHVLFLLGMLTSGGTIIVLLLRETGRTRRLLGEAAAAQARIRHLADHDTLTGLPNRLLFQDRLGQALNQARRHGSGIALHFLDIDRFKAINDTLGHAAGDAALRSLAGRASACLRANDTLARLGGDEFAIIQADLADAEGAARLAMRVLAALREPVGGKGAGFAVTASIGIALYPHHGLLADELLSYADAALYRAKAEGRDRCALFDATPQAAAPGLGEEAPRGAPRRLSAGTPAG